MSSLTWRVRFQQRPCGRTWLESNGVTITLWPYTAVGSAECARHVAHRHPDTCHVLSGPPDTCHVRSGHPDTCHVPTGRPDTCHVPTGDSYPFLSYLLPRDMASR